MPPPSVPGVRDKLLDQLLATYLLGDENEEEHMPPSTSPNGDPKVTLRLTVIIALVGMILTGAGVYVSVRLETRDVAAEIRKDTAAAIDKHSGSAGSHPTLATKEDVHDIRRSIDELDAKMDRLIVDVAELRARKGKDR